MRRSLTPRRSLLPFALLLGACGSDGNTGPSFGGPPTPIALKFCAATTPLWVGYQNGTGAWTTVTPSAPLTYSFNINGAGAIAYVLPDAGDAASYGYDTEVVYASADELSRFAVSGCGPTQPIGTKTIRGALAGLGNSELGQIYLGGSSAGVVSTNGSDASYTLRRVADAPQDLIAVRRTTVSSAGDIARVIVRRGINPADGTTLSSLDFNSAEAIAPVNATVSVTGGEFGQLFSVSSSFATAGNSAVLFTSALTSSTSIPFTGLSSAHAGAGDLHVLRLSSQDAQNASRAVESYFRSASDRGVTMGPTLAPYTVTAVTGAPNIRLRVDMDAQPAYGTAAVAEISAGGYSPLGRSIELAVTSAYLGAAPAKWSLTMPDLTTAQGFDPQWTMQTAIGLYYIGIATGGNRLFFSPATDGQLLSYALRDGETLTNGQNLAAPMLSADARTRLRAPLRARPWTAVSP